MLIYIEPAERAEYVKHHEGLKIMKTRDEKLYKLWKEQQGKEWGKPKEDSGTWLMTYGDLMTLLLVFFVLLYTMTPGVEERVFNSFISYFQQHSGFLDNNSLTTDLQNNPNPEQVDDFLVENMERWQVMAEFVENTKETEGVDVESIDDGFLITLADSVAFMSGSSELLPQAKNILNGIATSIGDDYWEIEVQGHTDNVPIARGGFTKQIGIWEQHDPCLCFSIFKKKQT